MRMYKPKDGYAHNPVLKLPRNSMCPCGSNQKVKKCYGRFHYIEQEKADYLIERINSFDEELKKALGYIN